MLVARAGRLRVAVEVGVGVRMGVDAARPARRLHCRLLRRRGLANDKVHCTSLAEPGGIQRHLVAAEDLAAEDEDHSVQRLLRDYGHPAPELAHRGRILHIHLLGLAGDELDHQLHG